MAQQQEMVMVVAALLVLAAAGPVAYGQVVAENVTGSICCTSRGNCAPGSVPLPGVKVSLNCKTLFVIVATLAQSVTSDTGFFSLYVTNLIGDVGLVARRASACVVSIKLPLNSTICPVLGALNGTISGVPVYVNTTLVPLLGFVANFKVPRFAHISLGR